MDLESGRELAADPSGLAAALEVLGDRWTLLLVAALLPGPLRFTDLRRAVPGIASNVLTERLRRLEAAGLLESRPYSTRPWRAEYRLAPSGESLAPAIQELERWAGASRGGLAPVHRSCGAPLESRWYCPECEEVVAGPAAEEDVVDV